MRILALISIATLFCGCATVLYGTRQDVVINTTPQGAKAEADGASCETPCRFDMSRKTETVTITKEGFEPVIHVLVKRKHAAALVPGNFLPFLGLGIFVDLASGAHLEISPVTLLLIKKEQ